MDRPVRVLHVLGGLSLGGAESRIMDLYRCMDREKVQFDFLVHQDGGEMGRIPEFYDEEVGKLGGKIYTLPKFRGYNYFGYKKAVKEFFREHHEFAAVQGHMTSTAAIYLPEAAKAGILVRAAHARSAGVDKGVKGVLTRLLRLPLLKKADYCFACSKEAGESVFGRKWIDSSKAFVIPNAVDARKFTYRESTIFLWLGYLGGLIMQNIMNVSWRSLRICIADFSKMKKASHKEKGEKRESGLC